MRSEPTRLNGKYTKITAWESPTGASLAIYHRKTSKKAIGIVHINHGLADHCGRYARFAEKLTRAGFHVYAQDHRGHGATTAPNTSQGVFGGKDGWELVLQDIKFVNAEIHKLHPELPVIMFGHSMGALLSYNYLLRWPETIEAIAIWNTAISQSPALKTLGRVLAVEKVFKGAKGKSLVNKLTFAAWNKTFSPNKTESDWLSKDVEECQKYDDDPDCGWPASISMWQGLAQGIRTGSSDIGIENIPKSMPIFVLGGDKDPSVEGGKATLDLDARLCAAGLTNVTTVLRENGRHEALNEPKTERGAVMQSFVDWATKSVG
ncbi:MAG: alpha/beta hydrolase [Robiginitomaculum sp.]|nr:MAG: alpha/beta hydrolase [Robiginitomaculum sp.]